VPSVAELTPAQRWALAASAVLNEYNGGAHDLLGGAEPTPEHQSSAKNILSRSWGVAPREK